MVSETEIVMTHAELVLRAENWLKQQGCGIVFRDEFRAVTYNHEQPDAIGWRNHLSLLIECKASRADFLAERNKPFRLTPNEGMGDWRFYLCPPDMITVGDLPEGWGLLYAFKHQVKKIHGFPPNLNWRAKQPFNGAKQYELQMMYSALRRMVRRGHFDSIYEKIDD